MFTLWDYYSATGLALFWFCFWECVAFSYGYGAEHIFDHIEDMVGRRIYWWLKICWKYITPCVILVSVGKIIWILLQSSLLIPEFLNSQGTFNDFEWNNLLLLFSRKLGQTTVLTNAEQSNCFSFE